MDRRRRIMLPLFGTVCAQILLVVGVGWVLWSIEENWRLMPGLAFIGAGFFVAMSLVIDRLVPDATQGFVLSLKLVCVLTCSVCGGLTVFGLLSGRAIVLMPPT